MMHYRDSLVTRLRTPHYLVTFKVYVQTDGSLLVVMGNATMEVTADELHALLCGVLDYATVFTSLKKNSIVNGN